MVQRDMKIYLDSTAPEVTVIEVRYQALKNFNYLIVDPVTSTSVIVDPAWEFDKICHFIEQSGSELKAVLVTHAHPDHIHLADAIATQFFCPIYMSNREIAASGYFSSRLTGIGAASMRIGGLTIQPLSTPGHTPGCFCYLINDNLFTGDVLFAEGCGFCPDLNAANDMYKSLQLIKTTVSPHVRVYPGHSYGKMPGQTMAGILRDNIYLQFNRAEDFISYRMRKGQSVSKMMEFH